MPKFKNRVGERYGRLLVTSHAGKDARNKHLWLCKCDCGNDSDEIRMKARELDEKDFAQWWWETVYKGNVL